MICLTKADKHSLRHLSYNQSPPPLAPRHTTREDMNGKANLREHLAAGADGCGAGCNGACGCGDGDGGGLLCYDVNDGEKGRRGMSQRPRKDEADDASHCHPRRGLWG